MTSYPPDRLTPAALSPTCIAGLKVPPIWFWDAYESGVDDDRETGAFAAQSHRGQSHRSTTASRLSREYYAPADIAAYLGLSTYSVQELCRRGLLRHVRLGRAIRIKKPWADAYMERHEREPLL